MNGKPCKPRGGRRARCTISRANRAAAILGGLLLGLAGCGPAAPPAPAALALDVEQLAAQLGPLGQVEASAEAWRLTLPAGGGVLEARLAGPAVTAARLTLHLGQENDAAAAALIELLRLTVGDGQVGEARRWAIEATWPGAAEAGETRVRRFGGVEIEAEALDATGRLRLEFRPRGER